MRPCLDTPDLDSEKVSSAKEKVTAQISTFCWYLHMTGVLPAHFKHFLSYLLSLLHVAASCRSKI